MMDVSYHSADLEDCDSVRSILCKQCGPYIHFMLADCVSVCVEILAVLRPEVAISNFSGLAVMPRANVYHVILGFLSSFPCGWSVASVKN